ncbi:DNA adenine methylase [Streptococcus lutetiensis]|uniref:DNA adenine methylase n=1 Tax=Streptococcus lutetiensis TaxID=150055 RepID=UPI001BD994AE|nr:DNA adenine methylase [Streptococcus lutetiensis]MBT0933099.1 DNA adenine methylase [Streptococcus lutetiensis]
MLKLDEKMIRKGKPVGLPYQGSKKKISKKIVEVIKQNFGTDKPVYDVFGGGGAITAECLLSGLKVYYNDLDETITNMFQKVVGEDRNYLKTLIVSRDEFFKIRDKKFKTVDDELKLLVNSFGNNRKGYLYSKEVSDLKYNLAVEIIKKHDVFYGYQKTETYLKAKSTFKERLQQLEQLEQLQRLQQLEQLQQLQRLQRLEQLQQLQRLQRLEQLQQLQRLQRLEQLQQLQRLQRLEQLQQLQRLQRLEQLQQLQRLQRLEQLQQLEVTNFDYKAFSDVESAIFYLDPPYENTNLKGYSIDRFDSQSFYDWAYETSKKNIVLISSYEISDSRFECVYEFKNARSTLSGGNRGNKTEKLFMVKK